MAPWRPAPHLTKNEKKKAKKQEKREREGRSGNSVPREKRRSRSRGSNSAAEDEESEHVPVDIPGPLPEELAPCYAGGPPGDEFDFDAWNVSMTAQMIANIKHQVPNMVSSSMANAIAPMKKDLVAVQRGQRTVETKLDSMERAVNATRITNQSNGGDIRKLTKAVADLSAQLAELTTRQTASAASSSDAAPPPQPGPARSAELHRRRTSLAPSLRRRGRNAARTKSSAPKLRSACTKSTPSTCASSTRQCRTRS